MHVILLFIAIYLILGIGIAVWDFRNGSALHEPPYFLRDRTVSTAVIFIIAWPYKLLRKYFR